MRLEFDIGLYTEDFEQILKWYSMAFKEREPTKKEEALYRKLNVIHDDYMRVDKEDKENKDE